MWPKSVGSFGVVYSNGQSLFLSLDYIIFSVLISKYLDDVATSVPLVVINQSTYLEK